MPGKEERWDAAEPSLRIVADEEGVSIHVAGRVTPVPFGWKDVEIVYLHPFLCGVASRPTLWIELVSGSRLSLPGDAEAYDEVLSRLGTHFGLGAQDIERHFREAQLTGVMTILYCHHGRTSPWALAYRAGRQAALQELPWYANPNRAPDATLASMAWMRGFLSANTPDPGCPDCHGSGRLRDRERGDEGDEQDATGELHPPRCPCNNQSERTSQG